MPPAPHARHMSHVTFHIMCYVAPSGLGVDGGFADPGLQPGLRYFAPLGLTCPYLKTQPYRLLECRRGGKGGRRVRIRILKDGREKSAISCLEGVKKSGRRHGLTQISTDKSSCFIRENPC